MNMSALNKVLFFFYLLFIIVLLSALMASSIDLLSFENIMADYRWPWIAALSALLLVISFKFLFLSFATSRIRSSLLKNTEMGMIRISVNTLDAIAQKAVRSFAEVKDVKTVIIPEIDGVKVRLVVLIMPETKIPDLTQAVQLKVKEHIEGTTGVQVKEVQVYVENISTNQRSKIE